MPRLQGTPALDHARRHLVTYDGPAVTAYRNESDALRAQVQELEQELAAERANVARLKGAHDRRDGQRADSLVGAVLQQSDAHALPGPLSPETIATVAHLVRRRMGLEVTNDGRSIEGHATGLDAADGPKTFALSVTPAGTELRLETDVRRLPLAVALGPIVGAIPTLPWVLWQIDRFHHFESGPSVGVILGVVAAAMAIGTVAARMLAKRRAQQVREAHDGVWATALELCRDAHPAARVRVAEEREGEGEPERVSVAAARARG